MINTDSERNSGGKTILIVEDEALLRDMERSILQACGYNILEAESARLALEVWEQQSEKIDLLLTDIMLPRGISGFELARRLFNRRPQLKIIFTTGRIARDTNHEMIGRMNARFLQKPYQHGELIKIVSEALGEPVRQDFTEPVAAPAT